MADINNITDKSEKVFDTISTKTGVSKDNVKKITIGIVAIIVILLLVSVVSNMGASYMKPYEGYVKAVNKKNAKKYSKLFSKDLKDYLEDKNGYDDFDDAMDDRFDSTVDYYENKYGDDVKISFKRIGKIKYTKDELEDLQDELEKDDKDFDFKVKKAYKIAIKLTIKGDDEKETSFDTFTVVKVDGKWVRLSELR